MTRRSTTTRHAADVKQITFMEPRWFPLAAGALPGLMSGLMLWALGIIFCGRGRGAGGGARTALGLALVAGSLACIAPGPSADAATARVDGSALDVFWAIHDHLRLGEPVAEESWSALFATPAYRWQAPDDAARARIRARMELAFQPEPAALQVALDESDGYDAVRWRHHQRLRDEREVLGRFHAELVASDVIPEALALVQEFLPPGLVTEDREPTPVRLLFFGPDAFAGNGAVYVDVIEAFDRGDEFVRLLAHEFHHEFVAELSRVPALDDEHPHHWIVHTLRQLQIEGLADRIDKRQFPLAPRTGGLPGYVDAYNRSYRDAPQTLAVFDASLRAMANLEDPSEAALKAWKLFRFGAHPVGFFMANTIVEAQGPDALLQDLDNPFAFLRRFEVVRPTFSPESLAWLAQIEAQLLQGGSRAVSRGGLALPSPPR